MARSRSWALNHGAAPFLTVSVAIGQLFEAMVETSFYSVGIEYNEQPLASSNRYKHDRTICCEDSSHGLQKPTVNRGRGENWREDKH